MDLLVNALCHITVVVTGGTIEKTYDELDGSLANRSSRLESDVLGRLKLPYTRTHIIKLMAKDSLFITDEDRALIVDTIKTEIKKGHPIVIVHGTDTMTDTAELAFKKIKTPSVPVIFTGAIRPFSVEGSDAFQNVAEALLTAQLASPGFYLCFHNRLFRVPDVRKNKDRGTFEETAPSKGPTS